MTAAARCRAHRGLRAPGAAGAQPSASYAGYWLLLPGPALAGRLLRDPALLPGRDQPLRPRGSLLQGYAMTWPFSNYWDALQDYWPQFIRSFVYAGIATVLCLVLGYPLAYAIAFKSGRWKNLMLVLVIAPFFTSFLIRTLAWKIDPARRRLHRRTRCSSCTSSAADDRLLATPVAVIAGLTYNFLPFMMLPLYASSSGSTPGCSRRRATSTPARRPASARSPGRCRCPASSPARC